MGGYQIQCAGELETQRVPVEKYNVIMLFGYPGCGKGTQGLALAGMPNFIHLAMGDIFRALDKTSPIGEEFLSYATKGNLVPDELTVRVWTNHVQKRIESGELRTDYHVMLLDGIPRTSWQVKLLRPLTNVLRVIHLQMADQEKLVVRLKKRAAKSNRPDDARESVIRNRIKVYEEQTLPVLECFNGEQIANINADQPPLAVLRDICDELLPVMPSSI